MVFCKYAKYLVVFNASIIPRVIPIHGNTTYTSQFQNPHYRPRGAENYDARVRFKVVKVHFLDTSFSVLNTNPSVYTSTQSMFAQ
jgi:hypothetical protein